MLLLSNGVCNGKYSRGLRFRNFQGFSNMASTWFVFTINFQVCCSQKYEKLELIFQRPEYSLLPHNIAWIKVLFWSCRHGSKIHTFAAAIVHEHIIIIMQCSAVYSIVTSEVCYIHFYPILQ